MPPTDFQIRVLPSLTKVFGDEPLTDVGSRNGTALRGEVYSFQVAYRSESLRKQIDLEVDSDLAKYIQIREVALVPSDLPGIRFDRHVLRTTPGMYPDLLQPIEEGLTAPPGQWRAVWITLRIPHRTVSGKHRIELQFRESRRLLGTARFTIDIVDALLPRQKLIHTSWFHTDCIATHYGDPVWSPNHWRRVESFVASAVDHGINLLLTPLFTPPLDTAVGGERPTVQLIDVTRQGRGGSADYDFNFARLDRWVRMADRCGVRFFEMSHLFTQWGAKHCPKIEDTEGRKLFGWQSQATGVAYRRFLDQFLPALVRYIDRRRLRRRCYFHVSDEPSIAHLDNFTAAAQMVQNHLRGFPFIDALSNLEFYDRGLVQRPIPSSDHIEPFVKRDIKGLWTYYCVSQSQEVSNRFFCMPSARNRILGSQLYRYDLAGFLHWGFNFYYTQFSRRPVDPFRETDAGKAFPSGDAYLVYPGDDGPLDSIRSEVFREALQDQRALQLLENLQGRDKTLALLEKGLARPITMKRYPRDAQWLLQMRQRCNRRIAALSG